MHNSGETCCRTEVYSLRSLFIPCGTDSARHVYSQAKKHCLSTCHVPGTIVGAEETRRQGSPSPYPPYHGGSIHVRREQTTNQNENKIVVGNSLNSIRNIKPVKGHRQNRAGGGGSSGAAIRRLSEEGSFAQRPQPSEGGTHLTVWRNRQRRKVLRQKPAGHPGTRQAGEWG